MPIYMDRDRDAHIELRILIFLSNQINIKISNFLKLKKTRVGFKFYKFFFNFYNIYSPET